VAVLFLVAVVVMRRRRQSAVIAKTFTSELNQLLLEKVGRSEAGERERNE
jgi:hypothetical protein